MMYLTNKQTFIFAVVILLFVAFLACSDKENANKAFSGSLEKTFTGYFYTKNLDKDYSPSPFTLKLEKGGKFTFIPENKIITRLSSGTYQVKGTTVTFTAVGFWTADFDWNLIFRGDFSISESKNQITLTKKRDDNYKYIYVIEKN